MLGLDINFLLIMMCFHFRNLIIRSFHRRPVTVNPYQKRTTRSYQLTPPRSRPRRCRHKLTRCYVVKRLNKLIWICHLFSSSRVWRKVSWPSTWSRRSTSKPRLSKICRNLEHQTISSGNCCV